MAKDKTIKAKNIVVEVADKIDKNGIIIPKDVLKKAYEAGKEYPLMLGYDENLVIGSAKVFVRGNKMYANATVNQTDAMASGIFNFDGYLTPLMEVSDDNVVNELDDDGNSIMKFNDAKFVSMGWSRNSAVDGATTIPSAGIRKAIDTLIDGAKSADINVKGDG